MNTCLPISVQTQDRKIYRKDRLVAAFFQAREQNKNLEIDFYPEGSCATSLRLYEILDELCEKYNFDKSRITIKTANLLEQHDHYRIVCVPSYWYEIREIQAWVTKNSIDTGIMPTRHFGCFVSRSTWSRLWVSTYLNKHHADKTLQTYHYDRTRQNYNGNGYVGLDDLFQFGCNIIPDCANFLTTCPRTIDLDFLKTYKNAKSLFQHGDSYYPIQVPANMNLLNYYHDIFVDIVTEPNVMGTNFLVTEKLWRCIVARRPFIVLGTANYLHNLRKLGFDTFYQYWDESYDGQIGQTRIGHMLEVIDRLATWDTEQCSQTLNRMQPILDHNLQVFKSLDYNKLAKVFDIND